VGFLVFVLLALATFRTTRLLIKDEFPPVKWPRDKILNWLDPDDDWKIEWLAKRNLAGEKLVDPPDGHLGALGRTIAYLMTCPWCASVWVAAGATYIATLFTSVQLPWLMWPAVAGVSGLLSLFDKD
jgi:hypothetical protein